MAFSHTLCLFLAVASISKVLASEEDSLQERGYAVPSGGWNNPELYRNVDWSSVFGNKAPAATPPSPGSGSGSSTSAPSPTGTSSQSSQDTSDTNVVSKESSNGGNNHDFSGATTSSTDCPAGCAMTIKFTDDSTHVDFTTCTNNVCGGSPPRGNTKGTCICMNSGSVRVKIGTTDDTQIGATLIEGNAVGLSSSSFYDVSYVEGYSWPVVCKSGNTMSGHNMDLHAGGNTCAGASKMGDFCENPGYTNMTSSDPDQCWQCTLPSPFFAPASGAAYTYPQDDQDCPSGPNADSGVYASPMATGGELECCIGPHCAPNTMSAGGMTAMGNCNRGCRPCSQVESCAGPCQPKSKRGLEELFGKAAEKSRSRKRHTHHRHPAVHGSG